MTVLTVGGGQQYATLASAVAASKDGDVIQLQAGTYINDFAEITNKITIEGVGGMAKLVATGPIPNGKAILVTDTDITLDHLEFSGAAVADGNGAGVRYQGGNLTVTNSYFHDNQDGLLAASDLNGSITISTSEFAHNGTGDGYTHNLYVGDIGHLTVDSSYFHDAVVGHEIKSRAENTTVTNSRIEDGANGTASYGIDLPNGGNATIQGNLIEKGPNAQNPNMISYGEEGGLHAGTTLTVAGNILLNDKSSSTVAVKNAAPWSATVTGNSTYNLASSRVLVGPGTLSGTTVLSTEPTLDTSSPTSSPTAAPAPTGGGAPGNAPITSTTIYRFFSTGNGEHFYSASVTERDALIATRSDLRYEGPGLGAANPGADSAATPIYRFFDNASGSHFFTSSAAERDATIATRSDLKFEGVGFYEHATQQAGDTPVYRFMDTQNGSHFYTPSADERAALLSSRPDLHYEGVAFYTPAQS